MQFDNKVCIVTGGNAGIGRCIAESFSKEGARVYVIDRDIDHDTDENIFCYKGDISEKEVLESFAAWVLSKEERIDFLINNACLMNGGILSGCSYEDFMYVQKVGVAAPYWLTVLFKEHFSKGASIVNISSSRAFQSQADTESYTAEFLEDETEKALTMIAQAETDYTNLLLAYTDVQINQNGWTYDQFYDYLCEEIGGDVGDVKEIYDIICQTPGYYLYYVYF